jgi:hypothetical protein
VELMARRSVDLHRELIQNLLDKQTQRNFDLEKVIFTMENELCKLRETNDSLFKENYELLKYKFLFV